MVGAHQLLEEAERQRRPRPEVEPTQLPRGWRPCAGCGLAVASPGERTYCSLCLWDRCVERKRQGWACARCGALIVGRRLHARNCSARCAQRARWVVAGRPYRQGGRRAMASVPARSRTG